MKTPVLFFTATEVTTVPTTVQNDNSVSLLCLLDRDDDTA